jgi:hypothetical protein
VAQAVSPFLRVDWAAVPEALRARRANTVPVGAGAVARLQRLALGLALGAGVAPEAARRECAELGLAAAGQLTQALLRHVLGLARLPQRTQRHYVARGRGLVRAGVRAGGRSAPPPPSPLP